MPAAYAIHQVAGRSRLRIPARRGDGDYFDAVKRRLAEAADVSEVEVNARTGSVVLHHRGSLEAIGDDARRAKLFELNGEAPADAKFAESLRAEVAGMDEKLKNAAGGEFNLYAILSVVLIGLAVVQLFRGRLLGPATTLAWAALAAMNRSARTAGG